MHETGENTLTIADSPIDILVVDDEPSVRSFIARALSRRGHSCRTAADASEALAAALTRQPELTISDIRMPGKNGTWLLEEFKKRWRDMAVIMLTAVSEAQTAVECLKSGADDYLVKPIDLSELLVSVTRATEKSRQLWNVHQRRAQLAIVDNQTPQMSNNVDPIRARGDGEESAGARRTSVGLSRNLGAGAALELSALRTAGKLIADGASYLEVASVVGRELVDTGGLLYARVWAKWGSDDSLETLVDMGGSALPGLVMARRAVSTGQMQCDGGNPAVITCPIMFRRAAEGALQLAWPTSKQAFMTPLTEQLALALSASLVQERDAVERQRTAEELTLFYRLAIASRHSLDMQHVAEFLFASLHKIIDYDVAGLLLLEDDASLNIQKRFPANTAFIDRVREHIINTVKLTYGVVVDEKLSIRVENVIGNEAISAVSDKLRSFVNVPLSVGGSVVGLIHVSNWRDRAFTEEEILFLHRAANFLASSVQGVRQLLETVKGRVERMVDQMTDAVVMLDHRGRVIAMNVAARQLLRCDDGGGAQLDAVGLADLLDFDPLRSLDDGAGRSKRLVCVAGVPYQAQLSTVMDDDGRASGAVLAFRNFEEETRADEMKTELVNVVSHELRTPLTAIRNALYLLANPKVGPLTDKQSHFLDLADRNIHQLVEIINDLLDLSKMEGGKMRIDLSPISIDECVEAAVTSLQPQAAEKSVTLTMRASNDLPRVQGDAAALQRVLVNLVANAIKFTGAGGRVSVETSVLGEIEPGSGTSVRVCVSDSGAGIPKDELEAIFDKFHQVRGESVSLGTPGTGLGLSICRELVRAHHGRIWAESEEGKGSQFSFVVPVLTEKQLLLHTLTKEIQRSAAIGSSLVLIIVQLNFEGWKPEGDAVTNDGMIDDLLDCARSVTRRSADRALVCREEGQLAIVLPQTTGDGAAVFHDRLVEELAKSGEAGNDVGRHVGWAVLGEDGSSSDELYSFAVERARTHVTA